MNNHEHKFEASKSGKTESCECGSWRWSDAKGSVFASAEQVRAAEARAEAARKGVK